MVNITIKVIILDDEIDDDDYLELYKLREDCDSKIEYLNNSNDPETIKKVNEFKKELGLEVPQIDTKEENQESSNEDKKKKRFPTVRKFMSDLQTDIDVSPSRLLDLVDGIYGMDMTLLMVEILIPQVDFTVGGSLLDLLITLLPTIGTTMISFIILATFWIYHHQFLEVRRVNLPFLWLSMIFLALITFLPIATFILGSNPGMGLSNFVFGLTLSLTLIVFFLMFKYADNRGFIETKITPDQRRYTYNTLTMLFLMTVFITALDYWVSADLIYLYAFLPLISIIRDRLFRIVDDDL